MQGRSYSIYDVFTTEALCGNPLAVVHDAEGLDTPRMQAIAREFNLSETVFLCTPDQPTQSARARIFTPAHELPFAGHPTVGAAIAIFEKRFAEPKRGDAAVIVLGETIGPVRCAVTLRDGLPFAEFDLPRLPQPARLPSPAEAYVAALGLGPHEAGFENHKVSAWSAGVPYVLVPVRDLAAAAKAQLDTAAWRALADDAPGAVPMEAYVYCRDTIGHDFAFHARMFGSASGIVEDPATGSAAACLAGQIALADAPLDGASVHWIEQGVEMGRPSAIRLEIDVAAGALAAARIGGHAVKVAEGRLRA